MTFVFNPGALGEIKERFLVPLAESSARIIRNQIQSEMEDAAPRTGREYFIPGTSTKYTASAPGEPPAIREGVYRDSWQPTEAVVDGPIVAAAAVSDLRAESGHLIGEILEFGTHDLVNFRVAIEPRPHLQPAMESAKGPILAMLRRFEGL